MSRHLLVATFIHCKFHLLRFLLSDLRPAVKYPILIAQSRTPFCFLELLNMSLQNTVHSFLSDMNVV